MSQDHLLFQSSHESIRQTVEGLGHPTELQIEDGWTTIETRVYDLVLWIEFGQCDETCKYCAFIKLTAAFNISGTTASNKTVAGWNAEHWSKAYMASDDDAVLDFTLNMREGITKENFIASFRWFADEAFAFAKALGWFSKDIMQ